MVARGPEQCGGVFGALAAGAVQEDATLGCYASTFQSDREFIDRYADCPR
jgi:hypothetical protein